MNILLLGSGTQGLAMARDISLAGHRVILISDRGDYADASRYVDIWIDSTGAVTDMEYLELIRKTATAEKIDAFIPMGDKYSEFLSKNKPSLCGIAGFVMPDIDVFENAYDKNRLMRLCREKGYPHPITVNTDEISATELLKLQYPILIKPNITCGARGMVLCQTPQELEEALPQVQLVYGDCHLQEFVRPGGAQVEVQLYVNEGHELVNSSVIHKYRWYPQKGGSSCCAKSVRNDKIVDILYHLLLDLNWVGFADFDTIEDPDTGELLIMELNPRVPACVKCAMAGGIRWGEIIVNGYLGRPQNKYEYKEGEVLRHLGMDTLWFIKSPDRFKTEPCWFSFFGKHIHYQDMSDWKDPAPFIRGTIRNIGRVLTGTEKEKIK